MFRIGIVQLYNPSTHGYRTRNEKNYLNGRFFVNYCTDENEYNCEEVNDLLNITKNFEEENIKVDLIKVYEDDTNTDVMTATIHTHHLAKLQRKCKNIYKERQRVIHARKSPSAIMYHRVHGKWPKHCMEQYK